MGTRDIKLSLKLKRRQERSTAMQISDQTEPGTLLALGRHEMKGGDLKVALAFVDKVPSAARIGWHVGCTLTVHCRALLSTRLTSCGLFWSKTIPHTIGFG
jgi:hypothetical protein